MAFTLHDLAIFTFSYFAISPPHPPNPPALQLQEIADPISVSTPKPKDKAVLYSLAPLHKPKPIEKGKKEVIIGHSLDGHILKRDDREKDRKEAERLNTMVQARPLARPLISTFLRKWHNFPDLLTPRVLKGDKMSFVLQQWGHSHYYYSRTAKFNLACSL